MLALALCCLLPHIFIRLTLTICYLYFLSGVLLTFCYRGSLSITLTCHNPLFSSLYFTTRMLSLHKIGYCFIIDSYKLILLQTYLTMSTARPSRKMTGKWCSWCLLYFVMFWLSKTYQPSRNLVVL